jgi:hypothetical protein
MRYEIQYNTLWFDHFKRISLLSTCHQFLMTHKSMLSPRYIETLSINNKLHCLAHETL